MQHDLSTGVTRSRCVGGIDEHHFTASVCSFACEVCSEQAPSGIQNTFGQVVILDHVANTEIFHGQMIVGGDETMTQLVEEITALVGNALMLPLQYHDSLAPIGSAFLASGDTALSDTQAFLGSTIPGRMLNVFALTGGDERGEPDINTDIDTGCRHGLWRNVARTDRIPFPGFAGKPESFNLPRQRTMPAYSHTTNARHLEPTAIHSETIPVLLEPETVESVPSLEAWITWFFARFDAAKEGLERFIEIAHHGLQHVTVDRSSVGIGGFVGFDLSKLFVLADRACCLLVGIFALCETPIVPVATRLQCCIKPALLAWRRVEAVDDGFEHSAISRSVPQCSA